MADEWSEPLQCSVGVRAGLASLEEEVGCQLGLDALGWIEKGEKGNFWGWGRRCEQDMEAEVWKVHLRARGFTLRNGEAL